MNDPGDPPPTPDPAPLARDPALEPLRRMVEGEARRVLSDVQIAADPQRIAAGWERRFIADEARAVEMLRLYEELGYETVADPIRAGDLGEECGDCRLIAVLGFKMIYTRRRRTPDRP